MKRHVSWLFLLTAIAASPSFGQAWAEKMFKVTDHDFGTVARSAKSEYRFVFENPFLEDVHIAGVRSSCGCTTPTVENSDLKTYEKGAILAHFNTHTFEGQRGATLTVTIDKPFYAEVQLHVHGYIRSDVVVEPGSVQLGSVEQGTSVDRSARLTHYGYDDWKITDIKSNDPNVKVSFKEAGRYDNQVSYDINVTLDSKAPAGYVANRLIVSTNAGNERIPVLVEGRVEPSVSVSPAALFLGSVQSGQKVTKQLVVKSKKPFKITDITCDDKSFEFGKAKNDEAKTVHLIPVTFTAGADAGRVMKHIKIETDQGTFTPELDAYAVVSNVKP